VELTDVHVGGEAWWTLGFEATGPRDVLRSELETAAALVFAMALPGGLELDIDDSRSYGQWLQRAAAGTGIGRPQVLGLSPNLEAIRWPMLERTPPHIREG
jgi:hypothetical protein